MHDRKPFFAKFGAFILAPILLLGCVPFTSKIPIPEKISSSPTEQFTQQSTLTPSLLAEWTMGNVKDIAWSPDSKIFAVNYWSDGSDAANNFVQAFSVESLKSIWTASNSLASTLVFTPDGRFIVESNTHVPLFYWRDIKQGKIVHMGELTDMGQAKKIECVGGGQIMIGNGKGNFAMMADYNSLIGLNGPSMVFIRRLDFETGKCKELFNYQASVNLFFDLNASGSLLVYGGVGKDDSAVIRNLEKELDVCHIPKVEFGHFVPGRNILAVVQNQKIVFIDASTCKETRELNVSPLSGYETYLAFSPNGQEFAIARDSIQIMNISDGEIVTQISFPQSTGLISMKLFWSGIKFSPDGRYLLIAYAVSKGNEIQLWQLKQ